MLEGVELVNGQQDGELPAEVIKLRKAVTALESKSAKAIAKANRQGQISEKVLARNRVLERQLATVGEGKEPQGQAAD